MKKLSFLLIVAFITALVISSCNRDDCPAYSMSDTEQADENV